MTYLIAIAAVIAFAIIVGIALIAWACCAAAAAGDAAIEEIERNSKCSR